MKISTECCFFILFSAIQKRKYISICSKSCIDLTWPREYTRHFHFGSKERTLTYSFSSYISFLTKYQMLEWNMYAAVKYEPARKITLKFLNTKIAIKTHQNSTHASAQMPSKTAAIITFSVDTVCYWQKFIKTNEWACKHAEKGKELCIRLNAKNDKWNKGNENGMYITNVNAYIDWA